MCFLVAVYMISSIVFLLQTNPYTQDIYDFPSLVSSQTRIMKSRLYDFRSLTLYFFIDGSQLSPTGKRPGDAYSSNKTLSLSRKLEETSPLISLSLQPLSGH